MPSAVDALAWLLAEISQGFGPTDEPLDGSYNGHAHFNKGIDFKLAPDTPIGANIDGRVVHVSNNPNDPNGWGRQVWVQDIAGNVHQYGHLNSVRVSVGQEVVTRDILGTSGNSGASTGPHLSYDVRDTSGRFFDPSGFVDWIRDGNNNGNGGGGFDIPGVDLPDIDIPGIDIPDLSSIPNALGAVAGSLNNLAEKISAPFRWLAKMVYWAMQPEHWFKAFFVVTGCALVAFGLYIYVRGFGNVVDDAKTGAKVAAVAAV